ncbi:hypothetical protein ES703_27215 [subsurface metagenome]
MIGGELPPVPRLAVCFLCQPPGLDASEAPPCEHRSGGLPCLAGPRPTGKPVLCQELLSRTRGGGLLRCLPGPSLAGWTLNLASWIITRRKEVVTMVYQQQPGELLLTGQLNGAQLGNALFQFLPTMPHESPIPMPRALAKAFFPQGFVPGRFPAAQAPPVQPAAIAAPPVAPAGPVDSKGNQILRREPKAAVAAQPQPAPAQPRNASTHEQIHPTSQHVRIAERKGL